MLKSSPKCLMRIFLAVFCGAIMGCRGVWSDPIRHGSRSAPVDSVLIPEADPLNESDPENRLAELPPDIAKRILEYAEGGEVKVPVPRGLDVRLSEVYRKWYQLGYARTYLTGTQDVMAGYYRNYNISKEYRAKLAGWYDGGFAAELARLKKVLRSMRVEEEGGKGGPE